MELTKRKRSELTRPLSWVLGLSVTQAAITRAGWIWLKPCWMASRSSGSVLSEVHTWSVRLRIPRSMRPPPPEQDSKATPGWAARSRSNSAYSARTWSIQSRCG